jgi:hypothetical protein
MAYNNLTAMKLHAVVETPEFLSRARKVMDDEERRAIVDHIAVNPMAGDLIVGTGGARKFRWRRPGSGKRGGLRIITHYAGINVPVFLLSVFAKNEKANLSMAERNAVRAVLAELVEDYQRGVKEHVEGR